MTEAIKVLSLFSGIGGFEYGMRQIFDNECVGFSEIDKNAIFEEDEHRIITTLTNPDTKEVVSLRSIVKIAENGDMHLVKLEKATEEMNGKSTPIEIKATGKKIYVGNVSFMKQ